MSNQLKKKKMKMKMMEDKMEIFISIVECTCQSKLRHPWKYDDFNFFFKI